jgi:hypothetical protein
MSGFKGLEFNDKNGNKISIGKGATGKFMVADNISNVVMSYDLKKDYDYETNTTHLGRGQTINGIVCMNAENNYINGKKMPSIKNGIVVQTDEKDEKRKVYMFENTKNGMRHGCSCYPSSRIRDYVINTLNLPDFNYIYIKDEEDCDVSFMHFKDYPANTLFFINF